MLITLKHKQECLAKLAKERAAEASKKASNSKMRPAVVLRSPPGAGKAKTDGDVIAAALAQDLDALKELTSVDDKIALKKQLLPKWKQVVDDYRDSGAQHYFEPLVRYVIWLLDCEQIDAAMEYAEFAIAQQQHMPDGFKRDLPTYVAEEVQKWAERQFKQGHSAEPFYSQVIERVESKAWLVPQVIVVSKLYRLAGMIAEQAGDMEKAQAAYLKCIEVNPDKHGVKGRMAAVQAKLGTGAES